MRVTQAYDRFEAALKAKRAAEMSAIGSVGAEQADNAAKALAEATRNAEAAALTLLAAPATGPGDLVLKTRALRWGCPDGVAIPEPVALGGGDAPPRGAPFAVAALHYIVRDLFDLAS